MIDCGAITAQRLEELRTAVDVIVGEIAGTTAGRFVIERHIEEGEVLAPEAGIVLSVPISRGSVVTSAKALAEIGGGGVFLRLAMAERHANDLAEGDVIEIGGTEESRTEGSRTGILVRLYPQISGGRLQADVEVEGIDARFIGRRIPVRPPIGERTALLVPQSALTITGGLDFLTIEQPGTHKQRAVVPGATINRDGLEWREILSGLLPGDRVATPDE